MQVVKGGFPGDEMQGRTQPAGKPRERVQQTLLYTPDLNKGFCLGRMAGAASRAGSERVSPCLYVTSFIVKERVLGRKREEAAPAHRLHPDSPMEKTLPRPWGKATPKGTGGLVPGRALTPDGFVPGARSQGRRVPGRARTPYLPPAGRPAVKAWQEGEGSAAMRTRTAPAEPARAMS